jgi:hypothetical protein
VNITVVNQGDLPAYPTQLSVQINETSATGWVFPEVLSPGDVGWVRCFLYIRNVSWQDHRFSAVINDATGTSLAILSDDISTDILVPEIDYQWNYQGMKTLSFPSLAYLYTYYQGRDRFELEDFATYVFDRYDDLYVDMLAVELKKLYTPSDEEDEVNYVASFVQALLYVEDDPENLPFDYPRFPVEMVEDKQGDCEDKAILTASLLDRLGYTVSLLRLPNHMAVGVNLVENLTSFDRFIEEYYYLETTGRGWVCGKVRGDYEEITNITVYPISLRPLLYHDWKNATLYSAPDGTDFVKIKLIVENIGRGPAEQVEVTGGFYPLQDIVYNRQSTVISLLPAGEKELVTLQLTVPQTVSTLLKTRLYWQRNMVDEEQSKDHFPR